MSQQDYFIQFASELGKQLMCTEDGCIMTEIMAQ